MKKISILIIFVHLYSSLLFAQVAYEQKPANTSANTNPKGAATDVDPSGVITKATVYTPTGSDAPITALFDNGPVFNSTGTGAGGANESIYYQGGTGTYGSGCQNASGIYVADDFPVPSGKRWAITSMDFYSYQTNSTTTPTITGIYVRIWNGKPGVVGSTVIWGNMTTNRLESTSFVNVYRVLAANGGVARPIMKVVAITADLSLTEGNYWVEWSCTGSLASGPWAPPVVNENNVTGNAIQTVDAGISYNDVLYNTFAQGFPFVVNGIEDEPMPTLFDNGPVYNSAGTGASGANESIYYQGGTGTYGSGCQYASGIYVADDFMVPSGKTWAVRRWISTLTRPIPPRPLRSRGSIFASGAEGRAMPAHPWFGAI